VQRLSLILLTVLLPLALSAQAPDSATPHPASVTKGKVTVKCRNGATDAKDLPVGIILGKDALVAARLVPRAIAAAGFELLPSIPLVYDTRARLTWPDTSAADPYRAFDYPGIVASLIIGKTRTDSIVVFGGVEALCASSPGAPDSTVGAALRLAATQLQGSLEALRRHR
jgi:hypothetical protein